MAALRTPSGGRPLARRFWAFALAVACVGQAVFVGLFGRPKRAGEARLRWTPIFAGKAPEIRPEPDFGADFAKALKEGLGLNEAYEQQ
ncbi:PDZ domain-containing protein, partial [Durusdinium trenchii]